MMVKMLVMMIKLYDSEDDRDASGNDANDYKV